MLSHLVPRYLDTQPCGYGWCGSTKGPADHSRAAREGWRMMRRPIEYTSLASRYVGPAKIHADRSVHSAYACILHMYSFRSFKMIRPSILSPLTRCACRLGGVVAARRRATLTAALRGSWSRGAAHVASARLPSPCCTRGQPRAATAAALRGLVVARTVSCVALGGAETLPPPHAGRASTICSVELYGRPLLNDLASPQAPACGYRRAGSAP